MSRKVIAAFNMTLDGVCDHTAGIADEELHLHYAGLIDKGGILLYGRITYELMKFWQNLLLNPSGNAAMDDFARSMDKAEKIVFSETLQETGWHSAQLAQKPLTEFVRELKEQQGNDILVGSRSLIIQLLNNGLIDELQICIHPVIQGEGLALFDQISGRILLKLTGTKVMKSGAVVLYYEPEKFQ